MERSSSSPRREEATENRSKHGKARRTKNRYLYVCIVLSMRDNVATYHREQFLYTDDDYYYLGSQIGEDPNRYTPCGVSRIFSTVVNTLSMCLQL